MIALSENAPAREGEGVGPPHYLPSDKNRRGGLALVQMPDADSRPLWQEFAVAILRVPSVVQNHTIVAKDADDFRRQTGSISTCSGGHG